MLNNNVYIAIAMPNYARRRSNVSTIALARVKPGVFCVNMWPESVTFVESAAPRGILSLSANMFYSNVAAQDTTIGGNIEIDRGEEKERQRAKKGVY